MLLSHGMMDGSGLSFLHRVTLRGMTSRMNRSIGVSAVVNLGSGLGNDKRLLVMRSCVMSLFRRGRSRGRCGSSSRLRCWCGGRSWCWSCGRGWGSLGGRSWGGSLLWCRRGCRLLCGCSGLRLDAKSVSNQLISGHNIILHLTFSMIRVLREVSIARVIVLLI